MTKYIPEVPQTRLESLEKIIRDLSPDSGYSRDIAKKVTALQRGLTGERNLINRDYMGENDYLLAYLSYYWPVSYAQAQLALRQLPLKKTEDSAYRILDLGSGPGPMSCAAVDNFWNRLPVSEEATAKIDVTLFDISGAALRIAERLLQNNQLPPSPGITILKGDLSTDTLPDGEFDLILFGHSLNEIAHNQADRIVIRTELVKKTIKKLSQNGYLLMIEPALLSTSRDLIELRNQLCASGYPIHGPCTANAACTILETSASATCHDESLWKIPQSVQKIADEAGLDRNAIKMTWFAFSKPYNELLTGNAVFRVVSEPMLNKGGRVRYLLCGQKHRISFSAKKDDPAAMTGGFFMIKRGDIIEIENPEIRESGLGWQRETRVHTKDKFVC